MTGTPDQAPPSKPQRMWGVQEIGALFGVNRQTVSQWRYRYRDTHPCPVPDVEIGPADAEPADAGKVIAGWSPDRAEEWREWRRTMPRAAARSQREAAKIQELERQAADAEWQLRVARSNQDT